MFTLCSVGSLLLCVAAGVIWVRSYGVPERISYQRPGMSVSLNFDSGKFAPVLWMDYPQPAGWSRSPPVTGWDWRSYEADRTDHSQCCQRARAGAVRCERRLMGARVLGVGWRVARGNDGGGALELGVCAFGAGEATDGAAYDRLRKARGASG